MRIWEAPLLLLTTPTKHAKMATAKVFGTCDLLESTLLQLEFKDIITLGGVSKEWKANVEDSLAVKKKLFLAPDSEERLVFDRSAEPELLGVLLASSSSSTRFDILPAFSESSAFEYDRSWTFEGECSDDNDAWTQYYFTWDLQQLERVRDKASARLWHPMFLTQPPCTALSLLVSGAKGAGFHHFSASVHDAEGTRLELLLDTFERMVKNAVRASLDTSEMSKYRLRFFF